MIMVDALMMAMYMIRYKINKRMHTLILINEYLTVTMGMER